jgi:hypothetical protein
MDLIKVHRAVMDLIKVHLAELARIICYGLTPNKIETLKIEK